MEKREAAFQTKFNKWSNYNIHDTSVFELKYVRGKSLPFSAVQKHQIQKLLNAKHRKVIFKIPDDSLAQKPFDSFLITKAPSYIVVQYARETGQNNTFFLIDIDDFVNEMSSSDRKSLTEDRAREIGKECTLGTIMGITP